MQRSATADAPSVSYDQARTTVDFVERVSPAPGLPLFEVRFRIAPGGAFDSFMHYHTEHSEFLYCEKGRMRVTLGTETRWVGPQDGVIEVKPWTPHRWEVVSDDDVETVVWEKSEPDPELKELFFRNIFNLFNDHKGTPPPLQVMKLFADYDNYPIGPQSWVHAMTGPIRAIVNVAGKIGSWAGYHSVYREYTPEHLMSKAASSGLS